MDVILALIIIATILLLGVFGEFFFRKTGIPDALWLILFGFAITTLFNIISPQAFSAIIPIFVVVTLVVILFEGGLHLKLTGVVKASLAGMGLAILFFIFSVIIVTGITYLMSVLGFYPGWNLWTGVLLGAILGGTSSVGVIALVQFANLGEEASDILVVESAFNDALCIVVVSTLVVYLLGATSSVGIKSVLQGISSGFAIGIVIGIAFGFIWLYLLYKLESNKDMKNYFYFFTLAALFFIYILTDYVGGSAVIACFIFGLIMGNTLLIKQLFKIERMYEVDKELLLINSQLAFLIKSFFFVLIGMLLVLDYKLWIYGLIITVFLLIPRILAILIVPSTRKIEKTKRTLLYFIYPKGLAAGILAISLANAPGLDKAIPTISWFVPIIFSTIFLSILMSTISLGIYRWKMKKTQVQGDNTNVDTNS
ncbi:MAG: cation:proton antiporter [Candidatus ainarchaeum sp.]|nr:cation:proton antiporter [Candidatus ainarchaeum sp.]